MDPHWAEAQSSLSFPVQPDSYTIYKSGVLLTNTNGNVTLATVSSSNFSVTNVGPDTGDPCSKTIHVKFSILSGKYVFDQPWYIAAQGK